MSDEKGWTLPAAGNAFPFDNPGDWVKITVEEFEPNLPQTDPKSGEQKSYPSGGLAWMNRIGGTVLESNVGTVAVGSSANLYMKGAMKAKNTRADGTVEGATNAAITAAIKAATGGNQLMPGAELTLQYVGDEPDTARGMSPTKRYAAWYKYAAPPLGAVGPTAPPAAAVTPPPAVPGTGSPAAAPGVQAVASPSAGQSAALTPEQEAEAALAAWEAAQAPAPEAWEADPRVAPLRAKNLPDATIRSILKI